MNRFVKDNMVLFVVIGSTLLGALVMLVFAVLGHARMFQYHAEADALRKQIQELIGQSPAPVADNVEPIRKTTEFFKARTAELLPHFGQIKGPALDVFVKTLGVDKQKFLEMFRSAWEADESRNAVGGRSRFYERFSMGVIPNANWAADLKLTPAQSLARWSQALQAFSKEYQKLTVEEVNARNQNDILMSVLGVPRNFEGDTERCKREFILPLVQRMQELCAAPPLTPAEAKAAAEAKKKREAGHLDEEEEQPLRVELLGNAGTFGFDLTPTSRIRKEDIVDIVKNGEVIGDLVRRIATAKVSVIDSFDVRSFVLNKNYAGEKTGRYVIYHYTFTVFGDIARIRTLTRMLNDASRENRMYIVRSIFLYTLEDGASGIMQERKEESLRLLDELDSSDDKNSGTPGAPAVSSRARDMGMPGAPDQHGGNGVREKTPEQILAEEKAKPYHKRKNYGKTLFGGNSSCKAVFDVEYVYLAEPEME